MSLSQSPGSAAWDLAAQRVQAQDDRRRAELDRELELERLRAGLPTKRKSATPKVERVQVDHLPMHKVEAWLQRLPISHLGWVGQRIAAERLRRRK